MKNITVITGSRADFGLLEWPIKCLQEAGFGVAVWKIWGAAFDTAFGATTKHLAEARPDCVMVLGDRFEILAAVTAAHLQRIPIAHIAGGDVTEGSYDDAMRDCISRMASIHFVTSTSAMARLTHHGYRNVHLVGNPGMDYIKHAPWKKERPVPEPYVVVNYQVETIDGAVEWTPIIQAIDDRRAFVFRPNKDTGSDYLNELIDKYTANRPEITVIDYMPHDEYLNLLEHCEEFIGNSSSMLYEVPELNIKTRMIGKRQRGRVVPWGDGHASERIVKILKYAAL